MIDPLRPYWPTNRSIAGLLVRSACLLVAAVAVVFAPSRPFAVVVVIAAAVVQGLLMAFDWMELRRTHRSGVIAGSALVFLFLSLVLALMIEGRAILVASVR